MISRSDDWNLRDKTATRQRSKFQKKCNKLWK